MTTSYIITFYLIYIPICLLVLYAGYKIGYYLGKNRQMFPHIRKQNDETPNK